MSGSGYGLTGAAVNQLKRMASRMNRLAGGTRKDGLPANMPAGSRSA